MDKILEALKFNQLKVEDFGTVQGEFYIRFETLDKFYDLQIHNNKTWSIAEAK